MGSTQAPAIKHLLGSIFKGRKVIAALQFL